MRAKNFLMANPPSFIYGQNQFSFKNEAQTTGNLLIKTKIISAFKKSNSGLFFRKWEYDKSCQNAKV